MKSLLGVKNKETHCVDSTTHAANCKLADRSQPPHQFSILFQYDKGATENSAGTWQVSSIAYFCSQTITM